MYGISGFIEAAPKAKARRAHATGKKVHEGHYPTRGDMDLMDPGEIDQMKYEHGLMRHFNHAFRTAEEVLDGEQVGQPDGADFRDHLDEAEDYAWCQLLGGGGVILVHECTAAFLERIEKSGCTGILELEPGVYFFPHRHLNILALAG